MYPACTTRVLFGATELRFWQPRLQRSQRKKRQGTQPQLFTLIGNKYTNNESICRHYGGSWATWKRCLETNKEKKTCFFFFKANLLIPKGEFSEESDIFRGRCTCLNEHIYHLFTNKKDILLKFCGISHAGR